MADHHDQDEYAGLPITWPFRFAFLCLILSLIWFCAGFAAEDVGKEIWASQHVNLSEKWWPFGQLSSWLILIGIVSAVGGAIYNYSLKRRQTAAH